MKVCLKCNTINDNDATICENCGAPLPMAMLAIVCPNCGKVCPLKTKECPACHHPLTDIQPKKAPVSLPKLSKNRQAFLRILSLVVIMLGAVLFICLSKTFTTKDSFFRYEGIMVNSYTQSDKLVRRDYYIIKGKPFYGKRQGEFSIAYTGNQAKAIKNKETAKLAAAYRHYPHYRLQVKPHRVIFTGPAQQMVKVQSEYVLGRDQTGLSWPDKRLSSWCSNDSRIVQVRIERIMSNTNN